VPNSTRQVHEHGDQLSGALPDIRTVQDVIDPNPVGGDVESDRQQEAKHQSFQELGSDPADDDDSRSDHQAEAESPAGLEDDG